MTRTCLVEPKEDAMSPSFREVPTPMPSVRLFVRRDLEDPPAHDVRMVFLQSREDWGRLCADPYRADEARAFFHGETVLRTLHRSSSGEEVWVLQHVGSSHVVVIGADERNLLAVEKKMLS